MEYNPQQSVEAESSNMVELHYRSFDKHQGHPSSWSFMSGLIDHVIIYLFIYFSFGAYRQWIVFKCIPSRDAALNYWKLEFPPDSRECWASNTLPSSVISAHVPFELWLGSKQSDQQQPGLWCHLLEQQLCSLSFCCWEEVVSEPHSPAWPWDWRTVALVENPWLKNAAEEKYLTKKQPSLKTKCSCNFSFLTHNPLNPTQHIQQFCEWHQNAKCHRHHRHRHHHHHHQHLTSGKQCVTWH